MKQWAIMAGAAIICLNTAAYAVESDMPWRPKPVPLNQQKKAIDASRNKVSAVPVMGWLEWAHLSDIDENTKAKLDTGAKTSSLNANIVKTFERDGKEYALFRIDLNRKYKASDELLEREVTRWVKIKMKDGKLQKRPVVKMSFCIHRTAFEGEVSLAKRDSFNYSLLVGRNMLAGIFAVDPSAIFTTTPHCK